MLIFGYHKSFRYSFLEALLAPIPSAVTTFVCNENPFVPAFRHKRLPHTVMIFNLCSVNSLRSKSKSKTLKLYAMKTCLECDEKIAGREDKKFCSDCCRNSYNNKMNKDSTNFMRNVNNRLRRNYRVLSELNPAGKSRIDRGKLLSKGFDFEFFTNLLQTKTGNTYYFVYDQGYLHLNNDSFMLVKKDH